MWACDSWVAELRDDGIDVKRLCNALGIETNSLSTYLPLDTAVADYVSINVGFDVMYWTETLAVLSSYRSKLNVVPHKVKLIKTLDDIEYAKQSGKLAVSFDIEGVDALNIDLGVVSVLTGWVFSWAITMCVVRPLQTTLAISQI